MAEHLPGGDDGLPSLDERQLAVLRALDASLLAAARQVGAREVGYPPLSRIESLHPIDHFRNFPHLGLLATTLRREKAGAMASSKGPRVPEITADDLEPPRYVLPTAACYPVYQRLRGSTLADAQRTTVLQRCFRNETAYDGLGRLLGFSMREVVIVGTQDEVRAFLTDRKAWIAAFAAGLGLDLRVQVAVDPFFEPTGARARMQQLFPVKEEFVHGGSMAVASVNFHRNFFGERWNIRTRDGKAAFTGCAAFGLERWLQALTERWQDDLDGMVARLTRLAAGGPPA